MLDQSIQIAKHTGYDRYPHIFTAASGILSSLDTEAKKFLSFGCSRGDEVEAMGKYFRSGQFYGCDIDHGMVDLAHRRFGDRATIFRSSEDDILKNGPYSVIFAMSVLCVHGEGEKNIANLLPFERYDRIIESLISAIEPGGLLVVYNTSYLTRECTAYSSLTPITHPAVPENGFVAKYNTGGARIATWPTNGSQICTLLDASGLSDFDLTDVIYQKGAAKDGEVPGKRLYFVQPQADGGHPAGPSWTRAAVKRPKTLDLDRTTSLAYQAGRVVRITQHHRPSVLSGYDYRHPALSEWGDVREYDHCPGTLLESLVSPFSGVRSRSATEKAG